MAEWNPVDSELCEVDVRRHRQRTALSQDAQDIIFQEVLKVLLRV